ncbi:hypothetical protein BJX68DRAFT_268577 [Aspergillus pseudodeflectus]|uniref:Uncharacterized protein n=1 Tax=Aspergillus pseudodeflectus TaxID=176178 RepID=A0ABR4K2D2_9EURO
MVDKPSVELIEEQSPTPSTAPSTKPPFRSRVVAHYKRWWWVHLLVTTVVTLVITLPLVYVGYPRIAQDAINSSTLNVTSMEITSPTPSGFHLHQLQVLGTDSIFHPKLYKFNAAVRFPGDMDPMMNITVPTLKANDGTTIEVVQDVTLLDSDAFAEFTKAMMLQEEVSLNIYGKPKLKQAGLHTITVTYNKTITMKGLNKLAGFQVLDMKLDPDRDDGMNAKGSVFIPNPSVTTLAMGNVTFDLSSNGTTLGTAVLHDLVIRPGNNTVPMLANIDQLTLLGLLPDSPPYNVEMQADGKSSVYYGEELEYFSAALQSNSITFTFDVSKALPA